MKRYFIKLILIFITSFLCFFLYNPSLAINLNIESSDYEKFIEDYKKYTYEYSFLNFQDLQLHYNTIKTVNDNLEMGIATEEDLNKLNNLVPDTGIGVIGSLIESYNTGHKEAQSMYNISNKDMEKIGNLLYAMLQDVNNLKTEVKNNLLNDEEIPEEQVSNLDIITELINNTVHNAGYNNVERVREAYELYVDLKQNNLEWNEDTKKRAQTVMDGLWDAIEASEWAEYEKEAVRWMYDEIVSMTAGKVEYEELKGLAVLSDADRTRFYNIYNNKEYLTMSREELETLGNEIKTLLRENDYIVEDETLLKQLLTKVNDMINSIRNNPGTPDEWLGQAQNYINNAEPTVSEEQITEIAVRIGQILITAATIIFPIIFLILGIKYFMAGPDEKGKLKTQLIGIITAAAITFGAYTIWKIAYAIINNVLQ